MGPQRPRTDSVLTPSIQRNLSRKQAASGNEGPNIVSARGVLVSIRLLQCSVL